MDYEKVQDMRQGRGLIINGRICIHKKAKGGAEESAEIQKEKKIGCNYRIT